MAEEMTKVYCCPNNDNTQLLAELMNAKNQGTDAATMAALFSNRDNGNGWMNNPFMYLIWLAYLGGNGGFGFGNNRAGGVEVNGRFDALSQQIASNQNTNMALNAINGNHEALHSIANTLGVSFAQMQGAVNQVQNAITAVGGQVGMTGQQVINSVLLGNKDLTAALQNCCCENKQLVTTMGYETQLRDQANTGAILDRIDQLANGIQTGFAQVGYNQSQNTNAIIQAGNANTQRIVDQLNNHWTGELSQKYADAKLELSQEKQSAAIIAALKTT